MKRIQFPQLAAAFIQIARSMSYMKLMLPLILVALPTSVFGQANASTAQRPARLEPTAADFAYGTESESQKLDFWQAPSNKPTPVVVMIHGGGWINGDKNGYDRGNIQPFLDAGISVAAIDYRLIGEAMEQHVEPPVKACLYDAARALQTIRWKAKEWNLDPSRIGATGSSAGACTCLWLALHKDLAAPESSDPIARQSTHFSCVGVYRAQTLFDPTELRKWMPNFDYGGHAFGFAAPGRSSMESFELLVANREKVLPWILEYSPLKLVTKDAPPIYIDYPNQTTPPIVGQPDPAPAHSALQGIKLAEKLSEVGVEVVVSYPGHLDEKYGSITKFLIEKLSVE